MSLVQFSLIHFGFMKFTLIGTINKNKNKYLEQNKHILRYIIGYQAV